MKRKFMIMLRFLLEILLFIILLPFIVIIEILWLIYLIKSAKKLNYDIKWAFNEWYQYLKTSLSMNKDFVINGL